MGVVTVAVAVFPLALPLVDGAVSIALSDLDLKPGID
jgi:hypothetical protein